MEMPSSLLATDLVQIKSKITMNKFPEDDMEITQILVVSDMAKSKEFYVDILGGELFREYGTSTVIKFLHHWFLLVTEGGPTDDKPDISFVPPRESNDVSQSFTIRVKDCQRSYEILKERGALFLTPPYDWGAEIRCFFKDPDGVLFEISQAGN
jgi:catechol 2,3-dioxygenase-like lactoylglutathione lyase family enzyme